MIFPLFAVNPKLYIPKIIIVSKLATWGVVPIYLSRNAHKTPARSGIELSYNAQRMMRPNTKSTVNI